MFSVFKRWWKKTFGESKKELRKKIGSLQTAMATSQNKAKALDVLLTNVAKQNKGQLIEQAAQKAEELETQSRKKTADAEKLLGEARSDSDEARKMRDAVAFAGTDL
jgi:hypothetical protein